MSGRGAITLVLLLVAAFSGWSLLSGRDAAPPTERAGGDRPDYILNDFELVALDAQGHESFTLRAPALARDPHSREMSIATPLFLIPPADAADAVWEVRADSGWVSADGDELRLRGAVDASSNGGAAAPVTITTEALNVFPERDLVTSDVAVRINQPGAVLNGVGLEVDLQARQYTLQSEVTSRYAQ